MSKILTKTKSTQLTAIEQIGGIYCHICHLKFSNKNTYDNHYSKHETGHSEIIYTCVMCNKQDANYPSFRGHCYTKHLLKEKTRCEHCNKTFSKLPALQDHIDTMHKHKCPSCKQEFPSNKEMQLHCIVHNNESLPFKCLMCEEDIDTIEICETHIENHSESKYICPICNIKLTNKNNATEHLIVHFAGIPDDPTAELTEQVMSQDSSIDMLGVLCCFCNIVFKNRVEFNFHFTTKHEGVDVVYSCNICGKQYDKYDLFAHHCYFHYVKDKYMCEICSKTFDRLSLLVVHTEMFHNKPANSEKPFKCPECEEIFASENGMRRHMKGRHDICVLKCPEPGCGQKFETTLNLIIHQKSHENISNTWCRQCGLQFQSLASCTSHLEIHKIKNFSCPICAKSYPEKYLLMKHVPQHFETVLHICKFCGKTFNQKNRLVQHFKIHTQKGNICNLCNKSFSTMQLLQQHLNVHKTFKPFRCTICPKTFNFKSNWWKHVKNVHHIDPKVIVQNGAVFPTNENELENLNSIQTIDESKSQALNSVLSSHENNNAVSNNIYSQFTDFDEMIIETSKTQPNNCSANALCVRNTHVADVNTEVYLEVMGENNDFDSNPAEGAVALDSIFPSITEKETQIFSDNAHNYVEIANALLDNVPIDLDSVPLYQDTIVKLPLPVTQMVPLEYGPDFGCGEQVPECGNQLIDLDGLLLPHIDPLLTINTDAVMQDTCKLNIDNAEHFDKGFIELQCHPQIVRVQDDVDMQLEQQDTNAFLGYNENVIYNLQSPYKPQVVQVRDHDTHFEAPTANLSQYCKDKLDQDNIETNWHPQLLKVDPNYDLILEHTPPINCHS